MPYNSTPSQQRVEEYVASLSQRSNVAEILRETILDISRYRMARGDRRSSFPIANDFFENVFDRLYLLKALSLRYKDHSVSDEEKVDWIPKFVKNQIAQIKSETNYPWYVTKISAATYLFLLLLLVYGHLKSAAQNHFHDVFKLDGFEQVILISLAFSQLALTAVELIPYRIYNNVNREPCEEIDRIVTSIKLNLPTETSLLTSCRSVLCCHWNTTAVTPRPQQYLAVDGAQHYQRRPDELDSHDRGTAHISAQP